MLLYVCTCVTKSPDGTPRYRSTSARCHISITATYSIEDLPTVQVHLRYTMLLTVVFFLPSLTGSSGYWPFIPLAIKCTLPNYLVVLSSTYLGKGILGVNRGEGKRFALRYLLPRYLLSGILSGYFPAIIGHVSRGSHWNVLSIPHVYCTGYPRLSESRVQ